MRVVSDIIDQTHPERVCNDIGCHLNHVLVAAQGSIMEARLPQWYAWSFQRAIDLARTDGLESPDDGRKLTAAKRDQPVQVVGHENEGKRLALTNKIAPPQGLDCQSRQRQVGKDRQTAVGHGRQEIDATRLGLAAATQAGGVGLRHAGNDIGIIAGKPAPTIAPAAPQSEFVFIEKGRLS
jgi:hypothetical protein